MESISVTIEGITPLIVNRFHEDAPPPNPRGEKPAPEEEANDRLYQNGKGCFYPSENIRQAMISAASRHRIKTRAATTDIAAAVYFAEVELPLEQDWHVDSRAVVIHASRPPARVTRHRPIFDKWTLSFTLRVDTSLVELALVRRILDDAGNYAGLGDWRPAKRGQYGRFTVTSWQVVR